MQVPPLNVVAVVVLTPDTVIVQDANAVVGLEKLVTFDIFHVAAAPFSV